MKSFKSIDLIEQLQADIRQLILAATYLEKEAPGLLLAAPAPGKWSVAQVLEHLNSYGRYYLPAIEKSLKVDKPQKQLFTPGWVGNYFTKIMRPGIDGKIGNKMNAPKNHRPAADLDIKPVIDNFLEQQQWLLELLEKAKQKDIGAIRTPISISRFIKLKVGDTFRFFVAHEQRHFLQIANTLSDIRKATGKFQSIPPAIQRSPVF
jgi:DinB family protein